MEKIRTKIQIPDPDNEGKFIYKPRKVSEVFQDLYDALKDSGLLPDDYFSLDYENTYRGGVNADFPTINNIFCNTSWDSSEGIYIDVSIQEYDESQECYNLIPFATGKSLGETADDFFRMHYIGGYIYRLFMGNGALHPRYAPLKNKDTGNDSKQLMERVNQEFTDLMKQRLFCSQKNLCEYASVLELEAKAMNNLTQEALPKERLSELLSMPYILEYLRMEQMFEEPDECIPEYLGENASIGCRSGRCSCGNIVRSYHNFCNSCGVKLDWENVKEEDMKEKSKDELNFLKSKKFVLACCVSDDDLLVRRKTIADAVLSNSTLPESQIHKLKILLEDICDPRPFK